MSSIFDKYKPTKTSNVKKLSEHEDEQTLVKRAGRIELDDKKENKIRIGPAHPGEETFIHMRACHWLKVERDGKEAIRTVANGRVHAGLTTDPIEAYINFCKEALNDGSTEGANKLQKLTAFKGGLGISTTWQMYAKKVVKTERGPWEIWEVWRPVRDDLKNKMCVEDAEEAIELDPFTHPLTGKCVLVTPDKKAKKTAIQIAQNPTKLTEEEMLEYDKLTPISQLQDFKYGMAEFELELEAIQYWDSKEEIDLFDNEELKEIFAAIKTEVKAKVRNVATTDIDEREEDGELPFEDDEAPKSKKGAKTAKPEAKKPASSKKAAEDEEEENQEEESVEEEAAEEEEGGTEDPEPDKFDEMDRKQLVKYKNENGYEIKLLAKDTDDEMRNKLREYEASLVEVDETEETEPEEEEVEKPKKPAPKKEEAPKSKPTLDDIKKKLAGSTGGKKK